MKFGKNWIQALNPEGLSVETALLIRNKDKEICNGLSGYYKKTSKGLLKG